MPPIFGEAIIKNFLYLKNKNCCSSPACCPYKQDLNNTKNQDHNEQLPDTSKKLDLLLLGTGREELIIGLSSCMEEDIYETFTDARLCDYLLSLDLYKPVNRRRKYIWHKIVYG